MTCFLEARIIWTLWHVPLMSVLTGFQYIVDCMEQDVDIRTPVITKIFPQFLDTLLLYQAFLLFHSDSVERVVAVKKPTSSCVF